MSWEGDRQGVVVAVDPGRDKCGLAVLAPDGRILERAVLAVAHVPDKLAELVERLSVQALVLGDRTGARALRERLDAAGIAARVPVVTVDEHLSSVEARSRYLSEHPPRGWRRWLPRTLLVPPEPVDDYVAVILAERYLGRKG